MSILAINTGSSSLRLSLFSQARDGLMRLAEVHQKNIAGAEKSLLTDFIAAVKASEIRLVVHRVVHGGALLTTPCLIDAALEAKIEQLIPLAPLHNPASLKWI